MDQTSNIPRRCEVEMESRSDGYETIPTLYQIARELKVDLKKLNTRHYIHISERYKGANERLIEVQQLLHDNPQDTTLQDQIGDLRKEASRLGDAERSFYQQKAKLNFHLQSDRGSKFYHSIVKMKQGRNLIAGLTLGDGTATTSPEQVVDEFLNF